ncbi:MAG: hypothetical protein EAZ60_12655 [Oscillatoriales cyanobacterium]|nr:MAG: hypothetical protein EAZ83_03630 [Oscillatoriales cyanobacterium]TAF01065.1 MAG: hypothetical protein EAZ79_00850 [Oscillatoriales cyanobacterium]TAF21992.1 MAG: hypothetical protein EAZ73_07195 [Oscillatoriales cyanobacterium]TAF36982.1 MAG: hypothetical protein EAZ69_08655 [Oscillatoriales cyanobacterium]TAF55618.1 MAG: hypothetical protein EAZ60_12655 [Oscillatoriales cyanobacterium]
MTCDRSTQFIRGSIAAPIVFSRETGSEGKLPDISTVQPKHEVGFRVRPGDREFDSAQIKSGASKHRRNQTRDRDVAIEFSIECNSRSLLKNPPAASKFVAKCGKDLCLGNNKALEKARSLLKCYQRGLIVENGKFEIQVSIPVKTYSGSQKSSTLLIATGCAWPKSGGCTAMARKSTVRP